MKVRKAVAGSVLAAGLGVAGLIGAGAASADVTDNPTTQDASGYGVTNYIHNFEPAGEHGVGAVRSAQTGPEIAAQSGTKKVGDLNGVRSTQGVNEPGSFPSISNAGGNK